MSVRIVRLGTERRGGEGLRIGTEMGTPEKVRLLKLLAALSHRADFSVACYCADESRCHRSVLRQLLNEHGARLANS